MNKCVEHLCQKSKVSCNTWHHITLHITIRETICNVMGKERRRCGSENWEYVLVSGDVHSDELKSGKKCLDPNLKNEITQSILKINKRFIAHFNR